MADNLTHKGATALANRLKHYWLDRGFAITPVVAPFTTKKQANQEVLYEVRLPELHNGIPAEKCRIKS